MNDPPGPKPKKRKTAARMEPTRRPVTAHSEEVNRPGHPSVPRGAAVASVGLLGLVGWVCPLTIPLSTALVAVTMLTVGGTLIVALWAPWHLPGYLDVLAELLHRLGPGWTGRPRRGWRTA